MTANIRRALLVVMTLLVGSVGAAEAETTLRIGEASSQEPPSLDATSFQAAAVAGHLLYNVMETLVQIDDKGQLQPLLAESWTLSDDGLTYTFNIRKNVLFHDGHPLTADDVVWTLTYGRDHKGHVQAFAFKGIDTIAASGPNTVVVKLKKPDSTFLANLAKRAGFIMSERNIADMASHPVGTGPFAFDQWNRGESLIFRRFDRYWGTPAKVDRVEWRFIPDSNAELNALLAGDVDAIRQLNVISRLPEVKGNANFVVEPGAVSTVNLLAVNVKAPPFDNPRVRKALAYAIDSQAIIDGTNNGYGTKTRVFASPLDPYFDGSYDPYPYDPAKARKILTEESQLGAAVEITAIIDNPSIAQAQVLLSQLAAAGFAPKIASYDLAAALDKTVRNKNYQITPQGVISERLVTNMTCGIWFMNYCNPKFDALIEAGKLAKTAEAANAAFRDASHVLADDVAVVPFYAAVQLSVHAKYVTGWRPYHPDTVLDLRSIAISR
jgi:peptide/nickel transport system substrate-binding protein